jgi:hypothetical protein
MRIRDPGWKKFGFGIMEKHPGSATLIFSIKKIELITSGIDKIVQKTALVCNYRYSEMNIRHVTKKE